MKIARDPDELRQAYAERGLTIRDIAKIVGVSDNTVRNALKGRPVSTPTADALAAILRRRPTRRNDLFLPFVRGREAVNGDDDADAEPAAA